MVKIKRIGIQAEFEEPFSPRFPEALVRGGLGYTLRRIMCINRDVDDCADCLIGNQCMYSIMYNDRAKTRNGLQVSPYAVRCHTDQSSHKKMTMNFTLFQPMLPYAGHEAGKRGVGRDRKKFTITGATDAVSGRMFTLDNRVDRFSLDEEEWAPRYMEDAEEVECALTFHTPARIKRKERMKGEVTFQDIVKSCVMRFKNLDRAFSEEQTRLDIPPARIIDAASAVETTREDIHWEKRERYSTRQHAVVSAGGFTGRIAFTGPVGPFREFLDFGSVAGIGKNTTFGCGLFTVEYGG